MDPLHTVSRDTWACSGRCGIVRAMLPGRSAVALAASLVVLVACRRGEPPVALGVDAAAAPLPGALGGPSAKAEQNAEADAGASAPIAAAADAGLDPGALPQTKDKPEASGAAFDARVAALWEAIVKDEPDRAMGFFFPVTAYEQVKAITNPASDWRRRLVAAYKRDVHAMHKR